MARQIPPAEFAQLLEQHPDYTAGYFMAAQTLAKAERTDEAKVRLTQGMTHPPGAPATSTLSAKCRPCSMNWNWPAEERPVLFSLRSIDSSEILCWLIKTSHRRQQSFLIRTRIIAQQ